MYLENSIESLDCHIYVDKYIVVMFLISYVCLLDFKLK